MKLTIFKLNNLRMVTLHWSLIRGSGSDALTFKVNIYF